MIGRVLAKTVMITTFVVVVMLLVEYLNVLTSGRIKIKKTPKYRWLQYIVASFLGATPGCLGAFTTVALYAHGVFTRGALVSAMVATTGDEAFVMFVMIPRTALLLTVGLFFLGIIAGFLVDLIVPEKSLYCMTCNTGLPIHKMAHGVIPDSLSTIIEQCKNCSPLRGILSSGLILILLLMVFGQIGPQEWNWIKVTALSTILLATFIIITVPEHFLQEHLWKHLLKEHVPRIFVWTLAALLTVDLIIPRLHFANVIKDSPFWVTFASGLLGFIPESGPHLVVVKLYKDHIIPFAPLLFNSIVQDGHGLLPLLGESFKDFLFVKIVAFILGAMVTFIWVLSMGW